MKKEIPASPVLLSLIDFTDQNGNPLPIDKKIEFLQDYIRVYAREVPTNDKEEREFQRIIKSYQVELEYLNNQVKKGELNKERQEYHSDNFWDTAFDIYYSDQTLTWPEVYKKMSIRMEELGLEMTMTKGSFKTQRKREQKKRNSG